MEIVKRGMERPDTQPDTEPEKTPGFYDRYIAPRLVHCACSLKPISKQRATIVPRAEGVVLEVGIGSGHNLSHYNPQKVIRIIGVDPSPTLTDIARRRVTTTGLDVEIIRRGAEEMPLPDDLADTAVITYSMCTIPDVAAALHEVHRVLKPSGRLLFVEHGRSTRLTTAQWQDRLTPIWNRLAGGCNLNRNIARLVSDNGFALDEIETYKLPLTPALLGFHYRGTAKPK